MKETEKSNNSEKMAMTPKRVRLMIAGLLVMVAGYILLMGGGVKDPQTFNYAMFDFRRLVAAPLVILAGITVIIVAILGTRGKKKEE